LIYSFDIKFYVILQTDFSISSNMIHFRFFVVWILKILMWCSILSILYVVLSCDEFCEELNRTAVVVNFYTSSNTALNANNLKIKGIENDSALHSNQYFSHKEYLQVKLPVNPSSDTMSFSIQNNELPADTIIIYYTRQNGFISPQCGCVTYAEISDETEITENTVILMEVANHKVTTVSYRQGVINEENIRIHY